MEPGDVRLEDDVQPVVHRMVFINIMAKKTFETKRAKERKSVPRASP